jgi:beta-glucanase (GH16 family)
VNTGLPVISGQALQGQTLSTTPGTWRNRPTAYSYQWQQCDSSGIICAAISGAKTSTYVLQTADAGHTIRAVATASNAGGSASATSAQTLLVAPLAPENAGLPVISGQAVQGQTLSTTPGTWRNRPTAYSYQWQQCDSSAASCSDIVGATSSSYTLQTSDIGHPIRIVVTATNAGGSTSQPSDPTGPTAERGAVPLNITEPIASGTVATGSVVSTTTGSWANSPTSYAYQWQHCPTDGSPCTDIRGATSQTYTVQSSDSGEVLRATVRAANANGSSAAVNTPMIPFGDIFSGSSVDTNIWNIVNRHGDSPQSEPECYLPANLTQAGNHMIETVKVETVNPCPYGLGQATTTANYSSADVQPNTFNFKYGKIITKVEFAGGTGTWPAFWMLDSAKCEFPNNLDNCPAQGAWEVDIAEINANDHTNVSEYNHVPNGGFPGCESTVTDVSTNYHIFEYDWTSTEALYKIDGVTRCTINTDVPPVPMFPIFDLALNPANWTLDPSTLPQSTKIDWIYVTTDSPENTLRPTLTDITSSGRFQDGDSISVSDGTWAGGQTCGAGLTCTYQWQHCDPTVTGSGYCAPIGGATARTYTLTSGDVGDYIMAEVTATTSTGASSASTALSIPVT